ncbi:hypothetical protein SPACI_017510 [Sporomusa acidovorans DSM 3132]|uniref:Uncharacterized protein n=1 Tax=Sporomusa acidovorans (strain ATCC 49682 / DSM 3132 / Mol) TaxID=1123286 RepID=A0ABZ3J071_SPOA4|nr:hypothetical protein SPACI_10700 [Sporomusa acidovorans DSM 3132]SDE50276.1 hypothetical protein SAMN04488499_10155 [Sporomusa acidovorans]
MPTLEEVFVGLSARKTSLMKCLQAFHPKNVELYICMRGI